MDSQIGYRLAQRPASLEMVSMIRLICIYRSNFEVNQVSRGIASPFVIVE